MAITLPRVRKSAAYRSRSASGVCAFTRSSSAGNFLAFGEVVMPPCSAPPALPLFGRRYHTPLNPRNKSLRAATSNPLPVDPQGGLVQVGLFRQKFATLHGDGHARQDRS